MQGFSVTDIVDLRFAIESQRNCLGQCPGCVLTIDERGEAVTFDAAQKQRIGQIFGAFFDRFSALENTPLYDKDDGRDVEVHFVQGDHLLMGPDEIRSYIQLVHEHGKGNAEAMFSTSLVVSEAVMREKLAVFREEADRLDQEIRFLFVIDPARMAHAKFRDMYERNARILIDEFGFEIEYAVMNVPPRPYAHIMPEVFDEFISRLAISYCEVNIFPTPARAAEYAFSWDEVIDWTCDVIERVDLDSDYAIKMATGINEAVRLTSQMSQAEFIDYITAKLTFSMYVDGAATANWMAPGGASEATPFIQRFGFEAAADTADMDATSFDAWAKSARRKAVSLQAEYMRDDKCAVCPHQRACLAGGFHLLRHVMNDRGVATSDCNTGIKAIFDTIADQGDRDGRYNDLCLMLRDRERRSLALENMPAIPAAE